MTDASARRAILKALAVNAIWINVSEVFRYFAFVMPMMREAFGTVPEVAPMDLPVFLIWGIWDTILLVSVTGFVWMFLDRFGDNVRGTVAAATLIWAAIFCILWLGLWNMNLATAEILAIALPLAWIEMVVAALVVRWARREHRAPRIA